jgi:hypothetical protein
MRVNVVLGVDISHGFLSQQLLELANSKQKSPKLLAEYFIKLGLNTVKFYGADAKVQFDIDNL